MAHQLSEAAKARLESRRQDYLHSMASKAEQLETLLKDCEQSEDPQAALSSIRQMMHRLSGSAGLYGCDELRQVVQDCQDDLSNTSRVREQVSPVLQALKDLIPTD